MMYCAIGYSYIEIIHYSYIRTLSLEKLSILYTGDTFMPHLELLILHCPYQIDLLLAMYKLQQCYQESHIS